MNCQGHCNQGRKLCCTPEACELITTNSDGSSPHADTRDLVEWALDGLLAFALIGALIFAVFAAIGFWSAR